MKQLPKKVQQVVDTELQIDEYNPTGALRGRYGIESDWIVELCRPTPKQKEYREVITIYPK